MICRNKAQKAQRGTPQSKKNLNRCKWEQSPDSESGFSVASVASLCPQMTQIHADGGEGEFQVHYLRVSASSAGNSGFGCGWPRWVIRGKIFAKMSDFDMLQRRGYRGLLFPSSVASGITGFFEQESSELIRQHIFWKLFTFGPGLFFNQTGQRAAMFYQCFFIEAGIVTFLVFPAAVIDPHQLECD